MDLGGFLVLALTGVFVGGPLYVFLRKRQAPVSRDWSGRPRSGSATPGYDGLGD